MSQKMDAMDESENGRDVWALGDLIVTVWKAF